MIRTSVLFSILIISFSLSAQQNEQVAIMQPINFLFEGMNKGDSALVHKAFKDDVVFATIGQDKEGNPTFNRGDLNRFLVAMGTPRKQVYTEPIWDVKIDVDGNLAQVWARYAFYLDKELHHCGVDAFQLYKSSDGWKIFHLTDTRQQEDCNVPVAIQNRFK